MSASTDFFKSSCVMSRNVMERGFDEIFGMMVDRNKYLIMTIRRLAVIEPLLCGIVLGLIPITLAGLFYKAYIQYKRGDQLGI
jgi:cytochrome b6-f complex subunit 5